MSAPFLLVTFRVGDAHYGLDVSDVVEVAATGEITPVPGTSERVAGVASWRGRTIPVLLLPEDLKREAVGPDQKCRLLVLSQPGAFAIRVEERYRGIRAPHKVKMAVSGCIRECAEAQCKDVGLIATEEGWNLYVGGNGGANPRHADLIATGIDEEAIRQPLGVFTAIFCVGLYFAVLFQRSGNLWIVGVMHGIADWYVLTGR